MFGASITEGEHLKDKLSESYSLTGTGVYIANDSGVITTVIYSELFFYFDSSLKIEYFSGEYTINGTAGNYSTLVSQIDGYSWESTNGVCTQARLPDDFVNGVWSDFVDTSDPDRYMYSARNRTGVVTLGNDGYPSSIYYSITKPTPYTFNITVTSYTNMNPPFSALELPKECRMMGFACPICYSSGMMVASSKLFLLCAVLLQFLFKAL